jgi:Tfp pilus assembly protein PilF
MPRSPRPVVLLLSVLSMAIACRQNAAQKLDALDARIFLAQAYLASLQPEKAREQATAILMRHRHNTAAEGINTLAYLMEGNSPKAREAYDRVRGENPQAARQLKSLAISSGQAGARDLPD